MTDSTEVPFDGDALQRLLEHASDAVLVGGQALAFWVAHYAIPVSPSLGFITSDADLLGWHKTAKQIAAALGGKDVSPGKRELTALAGQVLIPAGRNRHRNVDVLHKVVGFDDPDIVRKRSLEITLGAVTFRVMHPLDVLKSRVENLRLIREKQTMLGVTQARLSVEVARCFILTALAAGAEKTALKAAARIGKIAAEAAGVFVFAEYGVEVLNAVPVETFGRDKFTEIQWPRTLEKVQKLRDRKIAANVRKVR